LFPVPEGLSDEAAVITDPFANGIHMARVNPVSPGETVVVVGCGVMGLCALAALGALHPGARLLAVESDPHNARLARDLGAEEVLSPPFDRTFYRKVADLTGARMHTPLLSKPLLIGGPERVFDTVGSTDTIEMSLRVLANAGWFNLLGIGAPKRIDWTPVWLKELTLRGMYGYEVTPGTCDGEHDYQVALRLHAEGKVDLAPLVTHRFALSEWPRALEVALDKGCHHAVKIALRPK